MLLWLKLASRGPGRQRLRLTESGLQAGVFVPPEARVCQCFQGVSAKWAVNADASAAGASAAPRGSARGCAVKHGRRPDAVAGGDGDVLLLVVAGHADQAAVRVRVGVVAAAGREAGAVDRATSRPRALRGPSRPPGRVPRGSARRAPGEASGISADGVVELRKVLPDHLPHGIEVDGEMAVREAVPDALIPARGTPGSVASVASPGRVVDSERT